MSITIDQVRYATFRAKERIDLLTTRALRALTDPDEKKRLEQCHCLCCFYARGPQIAGQAFTQWKCLDCETEQPAWHNTAHPRLCLDCGKKNGLCVECLADLELRPRTKVQRPRASRRR